MTKAERQELQKKLNKLRAKLEIAIEFFDYEGAQRLQEEIDDIILSNTYEEEGERS
jgi:hypothetical protein